MPLFRIQEPQDASSVAGRIFPRSENLIQGSKPKTCQFFCQLIQVVNLVVNPVDFPSPKLTGPDQSSTG